MVFMRPTGWTNVNLLYLPDSRNQPIKKAVGIVMHDFHWLEDNDFPPRCRHCLFLTCSYRDNPIFFHEM